MKVSGEVLKADSDAAEKLPETLAETIEEEAYMPQLIFNVKETYVIQRLHG